MHDQEKNYIQQLRRHAKKTRNLLSNSMKNERECKIARAFLRCIGISFDNTEIKMGLQEPVDVTFRSAFFQIMEIVGTKKRGQEWIERERRYEQAQELSELSEPSTASRSITCADLLSDVADALEMKSSRYAGDCGQLDALIYIDQPGFHLYPVEFNLAEAVATKLSMQAWRSVQLLTIPFALVVIATPTAPDFLHDRVGQILKEWPDEKAGVGLFD